MTLYHMIVLKTHDPYLVNYENIKWISVEKHHIVGHLIRPLNSQSHQKLVVWKMSQLRGAKGDMTVKYNVLWMGSWFRNTT